jgi:pimeloyl-ACP methyl ester carboxylesterase
VPPATTLSPTTVAQAVLDLLDALDLRDVVLVGNDTGGAICQLALAGDHHRIAGLALTNCDAFETFPPRFFLPLFIAARFRPAVWAVVQTTRLRLLRHSPFAFGPLLRRPRSSSLTRGWVQPALDDPAIRRDITRFARGMRRDELVHAASWLSSFDRPSRLVWGSRDRYFTRDLGSRLAATLPRADLVEVDDATTFVPIDNPGAVGDAIVDLVAEIRAAGRGPRQSGRRAG